jgi:hypothetical protein
MIQCTARHEIQKPIYFGTVILNRSKIVSEITLTNIQKGEIAPNIGIEDKNRDGVIQILSRLLADEYILYTRTRKYHWSVTGPRFQQLHEFFKAQYAELDC